MHQQQIGTCLADQMLNARFHPLKHAKERERDADLKENQDAPSGFAPDSGPYEGQEFHAVLARVWLDAA